MFPVSCNKDTVQIQHEKTSQGVIAQLLFSYISIHNKAKFTQGYQKTAPCTPRITTHRREIRHRKHPLNFPGKSPRSDSDPKQGLVYVRARMDFSVQPLNRLKFWRSGKGSLKSSCRTISILGPQ
jgi:hypothetical protein